ncbi:hypothetical protein THAOC_15780, partial [Thalassiosira oceanica]
GDRVGKVRGETRNADTDFEARTHASLDKRALCRNQGTDQFWSKERTRRIIQWEVPVNVSVERSRVDEPVNAGLVTTASLSLAESTPSSTMAEPTCESGAYDVPITEEGTKKVAILEGTTPPLLGSLAASWQAPVDVGNSLYDGPRWLYRLRMSMTWQCGKSSGVAGAGQRWASSEVEFGLEVAVAVGSACSIAVIVVAGYRATNGCRDGWSGAWNARVLAGTSQTFAPRRPLAAPAPSLPLPAGGLIPSTWRGGTTSRLPLTAHNAGDSSRNDKAIDSLRKQELSNRLEDAECARHRPLESQVGPRLYTTSLRLHQPRLIPSTWRGGTTSRLPLPAHNAGDSSRPPDEGVAGRLSISTRTAFFYFRGGLVFN